MSYAPIYLKSALRSNSNYIPCDDNGLARRMTKEVVEFIADEAQVDALCKRIRQVDSIFGRAKRDMGVTYAQAYDLADYDTKVIIVDNILFYHTLEVSDNAADVFLSLIDMDVDNFHNETAMNREARASIEIVLENIDVKVNKMERLMGHDLNDKPSIWVAEDIMLFIDLLTCGWACQSLNTRHFAKDKTISSYVDNFHTEFEEAWAKGPMMGTFRRRLNKELAKIIVADIKGCMLRRSF